MRAFFCKVNLILVNLILYCQRIYNYFPPTLCLLMLKWINYFLGRRWDCWRRSDACVLHGSSAPQVGRWWPSSHNPRCPPPQHRGSLWTRRPSGHLPDFERANLGPQTQNLWWCWEPRTAKVWAWCPRVCREQNVLKETEKEMKQIKIVYTTSIFFPMSPGS